MVAYLRCETLRALRLCKCPTARFAWGNHRTVFDSAIFFHFFLYVKNIGLRLITFFSVSLRQRNSASWCLEAALASVAPGRLPIDCILCTVSTVRPGAVACRRICSAHATAPQNTSMTECLTYAVRMTEVRRLQGTLFCRIFAVHVLYIYCMSRLPPRKYKILK